jgi:hypothetical protein
MTSLPTQPGRAVSLGASTVRAVAHIHSEWSDDGSWSLRRIASVFARRRLSVVLMSEHSRGFTAAKWEDYWAACADASTDRVLLVPGIEYGDADDVVHIPVWGNVPFFGEAPDIGELLAQASGAGGTSVWAHPLRRDAWRRFEPSWREHLGGLEVWNRKYDGIAPSDQAVGLAQAHELRRFVALDFHTGRQLFPLSLRLGVAPAAPGTTGQDARIDATAVFAALRAGQMTPRAFGIPLERLSARGPAAVLRGMERARRTAARVLR